MSQQTRAQEIVVELLKFDDGGDGGCFGDCCLSDDEKKALMVALRTFAESEWDE